MYLMQAVHTDASTVTNTAVGADVDPLLDSQLDAVAADFTTASEAVVDLVVDDILDGIVVHVDQIMLDMVDVTRDDTLHRVIADVSNSVYDEVDCVVDNMLDGVVADVSNSTYGEEDCVADNMLGRIVNDTEDAAVGSLCSLACRVCLSAPGCVACHSQSSQLQILYQHLLFCVQSCSEYNISGPLESQLQKMFWSNVYATFSIL